MPQTTAPASATLYETYVNPQWLKPLNVLDMNVRYQRCSGADSHMDEFVTAICEVVELVHSSPAFWSEALGIARRAVAF